MGYLDTELSEQLREAVDEASPAELREMAHDGPERAVADHYKETGFWWADWIHNPHSSERVPYEAVPSRERLGKAAARGSFLVDEEDPPSNSRYCTSCGGPPWESPWAGCRAKASHHTHQRRFG